MDSAGKIANAITGRLGSVNQWWPRLDHQLKRPFDRSEIYFAKKGGGNQLPYAVTRAYMKRLDDVFGPFWQCRYTTSQAGLLICEVGLEIDGQYLWRADAAGETQIAAEKGMASDAFKRACVRWGIGRYLYLIPKGINNYDAFPAWATPEGYDAIIAKREAKKDGTV